MLFHRGVPVFPDFCFVNSCISPATFLLKMCQNRQQMQNFKFEFKFQEKLNLFWVGGSVFNGLFIGYNRNLQFNFPFSLSGATKNRKFSIPKFLWATQFFDPKNAPLRDFASHFRLCTPGLRGLRKKLMLTSKYQFFWPFKLTDVSLKKYHCRYRDDKNERQK